MNFVDKIKKAGVQHEGPVTMGPVTLDEGPDFHRDLSIVEIMSAGGALIDEICGTLFIAGEPEEDVDDLADVLMDFLADVVGHLFEVDVHVKMKRIKKNEKGDEDEKR